MALFRFFDGDVAPATPPFIVGELPTSSRRPSRAGWALVSAIPGVSPLSIEVALGEGDQVFGFGAGAVGASSRNGQRMRLLNRDTLFYGIEGAVYASFPLFWVKSATQTFAVLVLTSLPLDVVVGPDSVSLQGPLSAAAAVADVIVFSGEPREILGDIARLTGASFIPPAWALGFHQSRWSYRTADEVEAVAARFRKEDIPIDVIHLDIHYMDEYRVFSWDPNRFPEPGLMHQRLRDAGVRTLAIVDPGVAVGPTTVHDELTRMDGCLKTSHGDTYVGKVWPGATVFPDFKKNGVSAAWSRFHSVLIEAGVAGFWNDMNDPVLKVGAVYDPLAEDIVHSDGTHTEKRNLYANDMAAATTTALAAARPEERSFVLSRSGFVGIQRHAALWTGDNFSSWEQLAEGLHMIVHLGLSGVPLSGADIGGFGGRRGKYGIVKTKPSPELFVRWLELGAFMPFCRVHSVLFGPRQEPWSFSDEVTALSRRILRRRYRLLPLLLRLARAASATGLPLVRPLWLHHATPIAAAHRSLAATQVLIGEDLLFAPVLEKGARKKRVWLPTGSWIELRNAQVHNSVDADGVVVTVDAPLGESPLFVRAGVPFFFAAAGRNAEDTLRSALALELLAPAPQSCSSSLLLEDGLSTAAPWQLNVSACDDAGHLQIDMRADAPTGGFVPVQKSIEVRVPTGFSSAVVDGVPCAVLQRRLECEDRDVVVGAFDVPLGARSVTVT